jgi:hypothetical protein
LAEGGLFAALDPRMRHLQKWNVRGIQALLLTALAVGVSGCAVVGGIFKAGVWVGVIAIGALALLGFGLAALFRGK